MRHFDRHGAVTVTGILCIVQIVGLLGQLEPLSLFSDWAPPRRLSQAIATPTRITASSELDKQHNCMRCVESLYGLCVALPDQGLPSWP
jgi:hypothetical protein